MSPGKKVILSLVVAVPVAVGAAVYFVGVDKLLEALGQMGVGAFLTVGVVLFGIMALQAAAWARLEKQLGDRVPYRTLFGSTIVAMAGNIVMPSAHLGGEPAKIMYVGRNTGIPYTRLAGTVLLCKYIETISFVLFFALGAGATLWGMGDKLLHGAGRPLGFGIIVVGTAMLVICVVMWVGLARRWTPLTTVLGLLAGVGIGRGFLERVWKRALRMELGASKTFREEGRAVVPAFCWFFMTHVLMFFRPLVFFYLGWRVKLNIAELGLLFLVGQMMLTVQFLPSGLGTMDGGIISVVALTGMALTVPECAAFLLCIRFWDAMVVLLGMMLAARTGVGLFRKGEKEAGRVTAART